MAVRYLTMPLKPLRGLQSHGPFWTSNRCLLIQNSASRRYLASQPTKDLSPQEESIKDFASDSASTKPTISSATSATSGPAPTSASDWEDNPNYDISNFSELPHSNFGVNQHIVINDEFKEALRQILWQFKAPIRYAFAYGSGVFPQTKQPAGSSSRSSIHPKAPLAIEKAQGGNPKMIDFIFGVTYSQHWHSLNIKEHRDHYSSLASLGSWPVSVVQEKLGAGVYFNPYVTVNGTLIKYGVVCLDDLCTDLSQWNNLYLAGRLHKPVKILRDDARVRLANQVNLISALRTALLLLPPSFTEQELYATITSISYMGDLRMSLPAEDPSKVANIVGNNISNFRRLYAPLIENLPNVTFNDPKCSSPEWVSDPTANACLEQDMDPVKRGNMVRRLPKAFRSKLYLQYQKKFQIPQLEFNQMLEASSDEDTHRINRREGGSFERRIANGPPEELRSEVRGVIRNTIRWPSSVQVVKGIATSGVSRSLRYVSEKMAKSREGKRKAAQAAEEKATEDKEKS